MDYSQMMQSAFALVGGLVVCFKWLNLNSSDSNLDKIEIQHKSHLSRVGLIHEFIKIERNNAGYEMQVLGYKQISKLYDITLSEIRIGNITDSRDLSIQLDKLYNVLDKLEIWYVRV